MHAVRGRGKGWDENEAPLQRGHAVRRWSDLRAHHLEVHREGGFVADLLGRVLVEHVLPGANVERRRHMANEDCRPREAQVCEDDRDEQDEVVEPREVLEPEARSAHLEAVLGVPAVALARVGDVAVVRELEADR
eukprot:scaffold31793_cov52-Phaeocystis_antarctica.AAC.3